MDSVPSVRDHNLTGSSDSYMSSTGLLVVGWPYVLGCDAAGVVVEVGSNVGDQFKIGDEVCGCTRLGVPGHSPGQEFVRLSAPLSPAPCHGRLTATHPQFLMDAAITIPKPKNISIQQAATIGVGTLVISICSQVAGVVSVRLTLHPRPPLWAYTTVSRSHCQISTISQTNLPMPMQASNPIQRQAKQKAGWWSSEERAVSANTPFR